jgi:hypothetical protein
MSDDLQLPDPNYFQQASMLLLVFRFRGRRKLVASRLMESDDFADELAAHLPVLERLYAELEVSGVDVVSYQHGRFYTDPWPDGLRCLERLRTADDGTAAEGLGDEGLGDEGHADEGHAEAPAPATAEAALS